MMLTNYSQVENANQLLTFGLAIIFGCILCLIYDCYRCMLLSLDAPSFFIHLSDMLYCLLGALAYFCFLLVECNGEIRIYAVLGFVLGFCAFRRFCSKHIRKFIKKQLKRISNIFSFFLQPILRLIIWCRRKITPFLSKLPKTIQLFSKKKEKSLENDTEYDV